MGTDRKGPLAAFVVVAVIAAVLLVTSVRSQARPGWLDVPAPVAAASGALPPDPDTADLWRAAAAELDSVVVRGAVLVRKATAEPTRVADPTATLVTSAAPVVGTAPAVPRASVRTIRHRAGHRVRRRASTPHRGRRARASQARPGPAPAAPARSRVGRGRRLGWSHAPGRARGHAARGHRARGHRAPGRR